MAFGGAQAQTSSDLVTNVQVVGNQRIEADTVRSYMLIGVGDRFEAGRIDRSLKSLYSTGLFADVTIRREGNAVVVRVVENPVINQLAFEGNRKLLDEDLRAEVQLRPRVVYTRSRVQADVQRLVQLYQRSGRFAATIEPKVIQQPSNRVDLVFEINEGEVTGIRKINFVGNQRYTDGQLRGAISSREEVWYRFFAADDTYDPDRLTFDRELLRRFYLERGYADFRVVSAVAELTPDRSDFFVTFSVEEGEQYRFGEIDLTTELKGLDVEPLRDVVEAETGEVYNAELVDDVIETLTIEVGRLGHAFVDIRPRTKRNRDVRTIDVTFAINQGPNVYVERINVIGNLRTIDKVIRREMAISEGDAFNAARMQRSKERIKALGFFEEVEVTRREGRFPDQAEIDVTVEERPTGELSFGVGFSTVDLLIGDISIRERNLLGRGQDLRAALGIASRRQSFDISFTEPYFLDRQLSAGFDTFLTRSDFSDFAGFNQRSIGFKLRTAFPLTEVVTLGFNYELRSDEVRDVDAGASRFIQAQAGSTTTSAIGYVAAIDRLDDRLQPTSGFFGRVRQEIAGLGGNLHFLRTRFDYDHYFPIAEGWVSKIGGEAGVIMGLGEDIRITNRFFLGGNNFRGFANGGVGPRDAITGDALGGIIFAVGTLEQSFPLGLPEELGILGRVFTDFGTLTESDESGPGILDTGSLRVSAGVGVTWASPFGPVAVDLGIALVQEEEDEEELIRLNFGTRF
jgi:outer membrane protein insertion porin family